MTASRGSSRLIGKVWVAAVAASTFLLRQRTEYPSRLDSARRQMDRALSPHPDVELRQALLALLSLMAVVVSIALLVLGFAGELLTGREVWYVLGERSSGAAIGAALVAGCRYLVADRDRARWITARRPEGWRAGRWSIPGHRDLLYWVVVGGFLAWAMPYNEICRYSCGR